MKTACLFAGVFLGLLAAWSPVQARQGDGDSGDRRPPFEQRRGDRAEPRDVRPRGDEYDSRRLTPEERRDLRRDIRDAGRDIYERDRRRVGDASGGQR